MNEQVKLGFIGYGNMAQAMAGGLIKTGACKGDRIFACASNYDKLRANAEKIGIRGMKSAKEVAENSDFVILAVKPYQIEAVTAPILDLLAQKAVISVAAGYDFARYESILKPGSRHISTIPNTPICVGEGVLICENRHSLSPEEYGVFVRLFGKAALIESVDSARLSVAGTIGGCAPAFTAMYLEALADAGVKHGVSREAAYRIAAQMICGVGKLYLENKEHPGMIKDAVCSPGGTTIKGVAALEKNGFRGAVIEAIDAIENKQT